MIQKKRKNPLHMTNGIRYEIVDLPVYDEEKLIRKFSEILDRKFRVIKNSVPLITFKKLENLSGLTTFKRLQGTEDDITESLVLNSNESNINDYQLRMLFHELGHFVFDDFLSENARNKFEDYVRINTKRLNVENLVYLVENYKNSEIRKKDPVSFLIISNLENSELFEYYKENIRKIKSAFNVDFLTWIGMNNVRSFTKPASAYMPNSDEIFSEIFANYMMYDLRLLHSDNYRILKTILPELRS